MEIRCKNPIKYVELDPFASTTEILTFPTGEVDYSIYRPAGGLDEDLYFQGINTKQIESDFYGIKDTLDLNTPDVTSGFVPVYTPQDSGMSTIAQAIYNNPTYAKCVKNQVEKQKCDRFENIRNIFSVSSFKRFLKKWVTVSSYNRVNSLVNGFENLKKDILESNSTPFKTLFKENKKLDLINLNGNTEENFTSSFYKEIISLSELKQYRECSNFRRKDKLTTGEKVNLGSNVCDFTGNIKAQSVNKEKNTNAIDFISTNSDTFNYSDSVKKENPLQVIFRHMVGDNRQEDKNLRYGTDVRLKDFQIDRYNLDQFTDFD